MGLHTQVQVACMCSFQDAFWYFIALLCCIQKVIVIFSQTQHAHDWTLTVIGLAVPFVLVSDGDPCQPWPLCFHVRRLAPNREMWFSGCSKLGRALVGVIKLPLSYRYNHTLMTQPFAYPGMDILPSTLRQMLVYWWFTGVHKRLKTCLGQSSWSSIAGVWPLLIPADIEQASHCRGSIGNKSRLLNC